MVASLPRICRAWSFNAARLSSRSATMNALEAGTTTSCQIGRFRSDTAWGNPHGAIRRGAPLECWGLSALDLRPEPVPGAPWSPLSRLQPRLSLELEGCLEWMVDRAQVRYQRSGCRRSVFSSFQNSTSGKLQSPRDRPARARPCLAWAAGGAVQFDCVLIELQRVDEPAPRDGKSSTISRIADCRGALSTSAPRHSRVLVTSADLAQEARHR